MCIVGAITLHCGSSYTALCIVGALGGPWLCIAQVHGPPPPALIRSPCRTPLQLCRAHRAHRLKLQEDIPLCLPEY